MIVILIVIALIFATVGGVLYRRSPLRVRKHVLVSLHDGHGVTGVLHRRTYRTVTLRDAHVSSPAEQRGPIPVDGEIVVDRDQILFIQVVS